MSFPPSTPDFISQQVGESRYFFIDLNPAPTGGLAVVCGGFEACRPEYRVRRKAFPYHSIEYVAVGRGEVRLDGETFALEPGAAFSYRPGVVHEIVADPADPPRKYFVDYAGRRAPAVARRAGLTPPGFRRIASDPRIRDLYEMMIEQGTRRAEDTPEMCRHLLHLLAGKLSEFGDENDEPLTGSLQTYRHCRGVLENGFREINTAEELAEQSGVDPAYLCRLFRRFADATPYRVLLRMKMDYAAALLTRSDRLVKEAGYAVGYADPYRFSRAFKRVHGVSPSRLVRSSGRASDRTAGSNG